LSTLLEHSLNPLRLDFLAFLRCTFEHSTPGTLGALIALAGKKAIYEMVPALAGLSESNCEGETRRVTHVRTT